MGRPLVVPSLLSLSSRPGSVQWAGEQQVPVPRNKNNNFVCRRLVHTTTHVPFYSTDASEWGTRLSLYISLLCVSWRIYFWFVTLSAPWRRGHDHPAASPRQSLTMQMCRWARCEPGLPPPPGFMRFTWRCCSPILRGHSPQPRWPLCLFAAALIHQRSLPTEQQVGDLVTWLFVGRVSVVATVIGSSHPPYHSPPLRSLIGRACQGAEEETEQGIMGMRERPKRERQEFCNFTADRKSGWIFHENWKTFFFSLCVTFSSMSTVSTFYEVSSCDVRRSHSDRFPALCYKTTEKRLRAAQCVLLLYHHVLINAWRVRLEHLIY